MKEAPGTRDYDWWLLVILAAICTIGVLEIYSATHGSALAGMHMKQIRWIAAGLPRDHGSGAVAVYSRTCGAGGGAGGGAHEVRGQTVDPGAGGISPGV